jgi:hypothetical protein
MNGFRNWALVPVLFGLGALVAAAQDSGVSSHPMIGDAAPDFELAEVGGGTRNLGSLKGRFVVLHFGASW